VNLRVRRRRAYTVEVCVTDGGGLSGCDSLTVSVTSSNQAPAVAAGSDRYLDAGQTLGRWISFSDTGPSPWSAAVDYGEGDGSVPLSLAGTWGYISHRYDDPGVFTIEVCVTDAGGMTGCDSLLVTVAGGNVAPVVNVGADGSITAGQVFTRTGSFTDAGPAPWSATVNYGDGSGTQGLSLSGSSFTLSRTYGTAGSYTVRCV
jgi:hypothetical protein